MIDPLIWALLLFLAGIGLAAAEVFIPSAGILAMMSLCAFVGSVAMGFEASPTWGISLLLAAPLVAIVVVAKGFSILPRTWIGRRMILPGPDLGDEDKDKVAPYHAQDLDDHGTALLGLDGTSCTELRPSGFAEIGGHRYNVVSLGDFIRSGSRIRVVDVAGNRVVVEEIQ